jgi:hypothetical protein
MAVSMDVLNQIALIIRSDQGKAIRLRNLLIELAALPEYKIWLEQDEFNGRRFRLPRDFISADVRERRLLESMRLVVDDTLQVKINHIGDRLVFLTDGLFVPGDFRVFPWRDESDKIIDEFTELGWVGWPTVVIDPAVGCGHNAIRVDCEKRFAFDVSMRALCFAMVNSIINERSFAMVAMNDIEGGLPSLLGRSPERVLVVVNMPFALEPIPGALVRTAAGGENGYEKTVAALEAILDLTRQLPSGTEVRALVLAYSVGSRQEERWVVAEEGQRLFGTSAVTWRILEGERLWRINGKKEQPNPMPLSRMKLKADCRYYVRDPRLRDRLRSGYIERERDLRRAGFDSLAYGLLRLTVRVE